MEDKIDEAVLDSSKAPEQQLFGEGEADIMTAMNDKFPTLDSDERRMGLDGEESDLRKQKLEDPDPETEEPEKKEPEKELEIEEPEKKEPESKEPQKEEEDDPEVIPAFEQEGAFAEKKDDSFDPDSFDRETEAMSKDMNEKELNKWKALRGELKVYKQAEKDGKVPESVQTQIQELQAKADEADGLRQRIEELSMISAQARVQTSDHYKKEVLTPAAAIIDEATKMEARYDMEEGTIATLLRLGDKKVQSEAMDEALSGLSSVDQTEVIMWAGQYRQLQAKHGEMLKTAQEDIDKYEAQAADREVAAKQERVDGLRKVQTATWEKYQDVLAPELKMIPDGQIQQMKNKFMSLTAEGGDVTDEAYMLLAGTYLPTFVGLMRKQAKEIQELNSALEKAGGSRPKVKLKGGEKIVDSQKVTDEDDFMTAMSKTKFAG